jgi:two-component SAPR family response regulator
MRLYDGRFAMDFAYEDWATGFGEALHAAFLHAVETALRRILDSGDVSHGLGLAHQAARVEPDSEAVSESLVRLYRLGGAHSAAIEQYGHYARVLRELGVDPPRFEDV